MVAIHRREATMRHGRLLSLLPRRVEDGFHRQHRDDVQNLRRSSSPSPTSAVQWKSLLRMSSLAYTGSSGSVAIDRPSVVSAPCVVRHLRNYGTTIDGSQHQQLLQRALQRVARGGLQVVEVEHVVDADCFKLGKRREARILGGECWRGCNAGSRESSPLEATGTSLP